jgi:hypothetical protein
MKKTFKTAIEGGYIVPVNDGTDPGTDPGTGGDGDGTGSGSDEDGDGTTDNGTTPIRMNQPAKIRGSPAL